LIRLVARCDVEFERLRKLWKKIAALSCEANAR
jgi:hypothetical protein